VNINIKLQLALQESSIGASAPNVDIHILQGYLFW